VIALRVLIPTALILVGAALAASFTQSGLAVYYPGRFDAATRFTAAHRTLPKGTWVRVTHRRTGRSVTVKINDRGPWDNRARIIDLSRTAAVQLGIIREGVAPVTLEVIKR
jgi:rare lipoprotein A